VSIPGRQPELRSKPMSTAERNPAGIRLIAAFKLFKAAVLLAAGIAGIKLLHRSDIFDSPSWTYVFHIDPNSYYVQQLLNKVYLLDDHKLKALSAGTFFYAGLLSLEGVGLLLGKRWGIYVSIIITASFIPLEIYGISRHPSITKIIVLIVNIAIVIYLWMELRRERARLQTAARPD
jgi:uncharacterized membrane protein (DUF2068 family)